MPLLVFRLSGVHTINDKQVKMLVAVDALGGRVEPPSLAILPVAGRGAGENSNERRTPGLLHKQSRPSHTAPRRPAAERGTCSLGMQGPRGGCVATRLLC